MIFEGIDLPFWSEEDRALVIKETDDWIVAVMAEIFNDRIVLATPESWHRSYVAGFCYDKGGIAQAMATLWDPETEQFPDGFKKIAYDGRHESHPGHTQWICDWCLRDVAQNPRSGRILPASLEPSWHATQSANICLQCGSRRDNGKLYWIEHPSILRYPRRD